MKTRFYVSLFCSLLLVACSGTDSPIVVDEPTDSTPIADTPNEEPQDSGGDNTDASNGIFEGDVNLFTQEEVDAFGELNYKEITGSLYIFDKEEGLPITDLSSLITIEKIGDNLIIEGCNSLSSFNGLNSVVTVTEFSFSDNTGLTNLEGLDNLKDVSRFQVWNNSELESFFPVKLTQEEMSNIGVSRCPKLIDLQIFENVTKVVGPMVIGGCDALTTLTGLDRIKSVGTLIIINMDGIQSLDTFNNLSEINNGLQIEENENLVDLNGLSNLVSFTGTLRIWNNQKLIDIDPLGAVVQTDSLFIWGNPLIVDLSGLENLETVRGELNIFRNENLMNLDALANLSLLEGELKITNNPMLTDYCGIKELIQTGGHMGLLDISDNGSVFTLSFFGCP